MNIFNLKTRTKESKVLTKQISCKCECAFDDKNCNSNQKWNNDKYWCRSKIRRNDYISNHATCICENGKHDRSINGSSVIICD